MSCHGCSWILHVLNSIVYIGLNRKYIIKCMRVRLTGYWPELKLHKESTVRVGIELRS